LSSVLPGFLGVEVVLLHFLLLLLLALLLLSLLLVRLGLVAGAGVTYRAHGPPVLARAAHFGGLVKGSFRPLLVARRRLRQNKAFCAL
jgi:hypothetical protein